MKIQCSKCSATYNIPDEKIPPKGAKAKCKKCGNTILLKKENGLTNKAEKDKAKGENHLSPSDIPKKGEEDISSTSLPISNVEEKKEVNDKEEEILFISSSLNSKLNIKLSNSTLQWKSHYSLPILRFVKIKFASKFDIREIKEVAIQTYRPQYLALFLMLYLMLIVFDLFLAIIQFSPLASPSPGLFFGFALPLAIILARLTDDDIKITLRTEKKKHWWNAKSFSKNEINSLKSSVQKLNSWARLHDIETTVSKKIQKIKPRKKRAYVVLIISMVIFAFVLKFQSNIRINEEADKVLNNYKTRLVEIRSEYKRGFNEINYSNLLDPDTLSQQNYIFDSQKIIQKAMAMNLKYEKDFKQLVQDFTPQIKQYSNSEYKFQVFVKTMAGLKEIIKYDRSAIVEMGEIVELLSENEGLWEVADGNILFYEDHTLKEFNSHIENIQKISAQQVALQEKLKTLTEEAK